MVRALGKPGIYRIKCLPTNKVYYGQSVNVASRLSGHRSLLLRGRHFNRHLQAAWDKYGAVAFSLEPLLYTECWMLDFYESALIARTPEGLRFNMASGGLEGPRRFTEEHRRHLSEIRLGKPRPPHVVERIRRSNWKAVLVTFPDGSQRGYESQTAAARAIGCSLGAVSMAISRGRRARGCLVNRV